MAFQQIVLQGRLTKDPELFTSAGGMSVTSFDVAVDGRANEAGEKETEFFRCKAFKGRAEVVDQYFGKGDGIMVVGRIKTESWEKDGVKKYRTVVMVDNIDFPPSKVSDKGAKEDAPAPRAAAKPAARKPATPPASKQDEFDDDIPF